MCDNGAIVKTAIAIAAGTGVIHTRDKSLLLDNGGSIELTKNWAKSLLYRMGFVKRTSNAMAELSVEHFRFSRANCSLTYRQQLRYEDPM